MAEDVVIGAGSTGLAVLRALGERGVAAECLERGSGVGGLWRYENDNGRSSAYASLRTNVSRLRMQYPSFPIPPRSAISPTTRTWRPTSTTMRTRSGCARGSASG